MREIKCDGCGRRESLKTSEKSREIKPVKLTITTDSRDWANAEEMEADLCATCIGTLGHSYFGREAKGRLEVPGFAGPTELERVRAAAK